MLENNLALAYTSYVATKKCKTCCQELPLSKFSKDRGYYRAHCKPCRSEAEKSKIARDPEYAARKRAKELEWKKANRDKWYKSGADSRARNPWRTKLAAAASAHNSRARRYQVPGRLTVDSIDARFKRWGYVCVDCGTDEGLEVDHVIPFALGGSNYPSNIQPVCRSCNMGRWFRRFEEQE